MEADPPITRKTVGDTLLKNIALPILTSLKQKSILPNLSVKYSWFSTHPVDKYYSPSISHDVTVSGQGEFYDQKTKQKMQQFTVNANAGMTLYHRGVDVTDAMYRLEHHPLMSYSRDMAINMAQRCVFHPSAEHVNIECTYSQTFTRDSASQIDYVKEVHSAVQKSTENVLKLFNFGTKLQLDIPLQISR